METILVTGGAGFIGSHLCDDLLSRQHRVICLDNLCTGSRANIAHLTEEPRFVFIEADACDPLPSIEPIDRIFHLASPASPAAYFNIPVETAMVNALGTYHVLELAKANGAAFLLASTSEVYGDPAVHPQPESYWGNVNSVGPRSPYDEGKRFAEALATTYSKEFGSDVRIVRIFNTYGPRSDPDDGRLIPNFVKQAIQGAPITIYGDGEQTRSLCYVDDLVQGLIATMYTPAARGEVINLGCPDERSITQFAQLIRSIAGSESEIVMAPGRDEEPARRCPDTTKATSLLGWKAKTDLTDGLTRTIAWFREELLPAETVSRSA